MARARRATRKRLAPARKADPRARTPRANEAARAHRRPAPMARSPTSPRHRPIERSPHKRRHRRRPHRRRNPHLHFRRRRAMTKTSRSTVSCARSPRESTRRLPALLRNFPPRPRTTKSSRGVTHPRMTAAASATSTRKPYRARASSQSQPPRPRARGETRSPRKRATRPSAMTRRCRPSIARSTPSRLPPRLDPESCGGWRARPA